MDSAAGFNAVSGAVKPRGRKLKTAQLPSGLSIRHCSNAAEIEFLYQEQYLDKVYLQHGVNLKPGDVVLDIGANIGMFAMFASEVVGATGRVVACEPAPLIFEAFEANVKLHKDWHKAAGTQVAPVEPVPVAVGSKAGKVSMSVYPNAALLSTVDNDRADIVRNMTAYLFNIVQQPELSPKNINPVQAALLSMSRAALRIPGSKALLDFMGRIYVRKVLLRGEIKVDVPLVTVSQLLKERPDIKRVALLKVDVERLELAVLEGVGDAWPLIQQVALEVHDQDGRVDAVKQLLKEAGLTEQVISQDPYSVGTSAYQLAAWRP